MPVATGMGAADPIKMLSLLQICKGERSFAELFCAVGDSLLGNYIASEAKSLREGRKLDREGSS